MLKLSKFHPFKRFKFSPLAWVFILLILVSLACSFGSDGPQTIRIRNTLPTITPTPAEGSIAVNSAESPDSSVDTSAPQTTDNQSEPVTITQLPTLTPTVAPVPVESANPPVNSAAPSSSSSSAFVPVIPTNTAVPSTPPPTAIPPATSPPTQLEPNPTASLPAPPESNPTPVPEVSGWTFVSVRALINQGDAFVVGEAINNTGAPQREIDISGIFYNNNDQLIEDEVETADYIPVDVVPVGARIPFELVIESSQPIYRLDLLGLSQPADFSPRQDFEISGVHQSTDNAGMYCLQGQIKNPGTAIEDYLIILATAYDEQGQVVGFGEHSENSPGTVIADQTAPFKVCLDPLDQHVSSYELRAWGL